MENQPKSVRVENIGEIIIKSMEIEFTMLKYYCSKCHHFIGYNKPKSDFQCLYVDSNADEPCISTEYTEYEEYHRETCYDSQMKDIWNELNNIV